MFRGLLHAELWLLHKPGVRLDAGPAPPDCPPGFVQGDDLRAWLAAAKAALTAIPLDDELPLLLVGMSEGAELLPFLAAALPRRVDGLVLISGAGIDPVETGALQARRLGESAQWQALERAQGSSLPDEQMVDGRTLRYWRGLWDWRSEAALMAAPMPVMQVWGDADALLPAEAFERFAERAQQRAGRPILPTAFRRRRPWPAGRRRRRSATGLGGDRALGAPAGAGALRGGRRALMSF